MDALAATPVRSGVRTLEAPRADSPEERELDIAAKGFEKLMVQRLLTEARRTSFGEEPSNAQSNYDAMFDEEIAGLISEGGTLGLADSLRRSLGDTRQLSVQQSVPSGSAGLSLPAPGSGVHGLDASSLATLRALVEPGSGADEQRHATLASPGAIDDQGAIPLLASLEASITRAERAAAGSAPAQQREFLARLRPHAQDTAQRLGTSTEAVLAVAALETGWGRRPIIDSAGRDANNLFGIKAHAHAGPSVTHRTTEYVDGQARTIEARFRRYNTAGASVQDFGDFLIQNPRYRPALEQAADPEGFLRALQDAGYATDPDYADKAIRVLQRVQAHLAGENS